MLAVVGQWSSGYQRLPGSGELNAPSLFTQTIDKNWEEPPFPQPEPDLSCPRPTRKGPEHSVHQSCNRC